MRSEYKRGGNAAERLECTRKAGGFWDQRSKSTFIRTQAEGRQDVTMKKRRVSEFKTYFIYQLLQIEMNIEISMIRIINLWHDA